MTWRAIAEEDSIRACLTWCDGGPAKRPADARPEICRVRAVWQPKPDIEPFELNLGEYFAEVWGEGPR